MSMRHEGVVGLWVGLAQSAEALEAALRVTFSPDGNFEGSAFSRAFGIPYYDDGFRELLMLPSSTNQLSELIRGVSYEQQILPRFSAIECARGEETNCAVLLYNIGYAGIVRDWRTSGVHLRFYGTVPYERGEP